MYAPPAPPQLDRVLQVQHLVEQDVFDGVARHAWVVEDVYKRQELVKLSVLILRGVCAVSGTAKTAISNDSRTTQAYRAEREAGKS